MDSNQVNFWLSLNAEKFAPETLPAIKSKLEQMDDTQMMYLQSVSFKKPSTIFLIALIFGLERFLLNDIALGIVKVITGYGCGIWWLIDIFSAKKRAYKYNFEQFQKTTVMASGNGIPFSSPIDIPTKSTDITENNLGNNGGTKFMAANNDNLDAFKAKASEISRNPIISKVKNILLSPKIELEAIDKDNNPLSKTLTGYLLLLAAVPAVVSFLGYFFYGIFGKMPFGHCFGMGFKVAIMLYATIVGGVFLTALVANLLAEKFGSVKDFNKAFSLAAYSWTPVCVLGILLIYPSLFTFWLWVIAGVLYGSFLIYKGIIAILKTPFEQLTPFTAICAGGFAIAFILLIIILSYLFLGDLYFNVLSYFSYSSYNSYFRY